MQFKFRVSIIMYMDTFSMCIEWLQVVLSMSLGENNGNSTRLFQVS